MSPDPRIARTRGKVLDAAWELLNEVGFDGVTVELVSERAAVSRSTLYRHWRSIPELLRDAFAAQAGPPSPSGGPVGGLAALTAYAQAVATGLDEVWGLAAVSLAASAAVDPSQRAVLAVFVDGTRADLSAVVERARVAGELVVEDADAVVERLTDLVVAPLFYRHHFVGRPVTAEGAAALAAHAWAAVGGNPLVP